MSLIGSNIGFTDGPGDDTHEVPCPGDLSTEVGALGPGIFSVVVGEATFDNVIIAVDLSISPELKIICVDDVATFTAIGEPSGGTYSWAASGGAPDTGGDSSSFSTTFSTGEIYQVSVTYEVNGCSCQVTATVTAVQISVTAMPDRVCVNKNITFIATTFPEDAEVDWTGGGDPANLTYTTTLHPSDGGIVGAMDLPIGQSRTIANYDSPLDLFPIVHPSGGNINHVNVKYGFTINLYGWTNTIANANPTPSVTNAVGFRTFVLLRSIEWASTNENLISVDVSGNATITSVKRDVSINLTTTFTPPINGSIPPWEVRPPTLVFHQGCDER